MVVEISIPLKSKHLVWTKVTNSCSNRGANCALHKSHLDISNILELNPGRTHFDHIFFKS